MVVFQVEETEKKIFALCLDAPVATDQHQNKKHMENAALENTRLGNRHVRIKKSRRIQNKSALIT
jgi:hypothetical protein